MELALLGMALLIVGFALVAIALVLAIARAGRGEFRGGGVLLIGPLPIVVGTDEEVVKWAIALTVVAMAFFLALTLVATGVVGPWIRGYSGC